MTHVSGISVVLRTLRMSLVLLFVEPTPVFGLLPLLFANPSFPLVVTALVSLLPVTPFRNETEKVTSWRPRRASRPPDIWAYLPRRRLPRDVQRNIGRFGRPSEERFRPFDRFVSLRSVT